jgi:hypothetical protein
MRDKKHKNKILERPVELPTITEIKLENIALWAPPRPLWTGSFFRFQKRKFKKIYLNSGFEL